MTGFDVSLSHFEIGVRSATRVEDFYPRVPGFVESDRAIGAGGLRQGRSSGGARGR